MRGYEHKQEYEDTLDTKEPGYPKMLGKVNKKEYENTYNARIQKNWNTEQK
jgi:hypothetical protein